MREDRNKHSSKHERGRDKDSEHKTKKRHKSTHESSKKHKRRATDSMHITDDDPNDDDIWVEKNIDLDSERLLATDIPTAESLKLMSHAKAFDSESGGAVDFFSSLGTERKRKSQPDKLDPDKPKISSLELNADVQEAREMDHTSTPLPPAPITPGGPGSSWRMMRLRRVYETAEEDHRPVEEVALERFGTLRAFEEAKEERRILGERAHQRGGPGAQKLASQKNNGRDTEGDKRFMFTDIGASGASSRSSSFRRPATTNDSVPATPSTSSSNKVRVDRRLDSLRLPSQAASPLAQSHTPIPSVMTPSVAGVSTSRAISPSSLNKLQAKVLRAKLTNAPNAAELEREYEEEARKAYGGPEESVVRTRIEVLPTLDAHGRLYDVGHGKSDAEPLQGNRKKKEKFENRDPKTGNIIRYNADDDTMTLGEMLRQERFGAGISDQKDLDAQYAKAIMGDGKFENDLEYIDDNAERLGRQKMRSDAMKRQFAIHDYKRTQKALATCQFCYGEDDSPPKAPVIAMGTRAYLSCTLTEQLLDGHCLIIPIQHYLTMLEADDDVWDEVRNFMKGLMKMFAEEDKGVVFYETVISLKWQKHTCIEAVPLPWVQYDDIPQYFKESILASEAEWSQHKKLIDFSKRPGGFRRAMVPNLPYFMVQFDHKGERGYGHVIEGTGESTNAGEEDGALDEGEKGGGEFPKYFAGEIIGNVMDVEPRRWRRPRKVDSRLYKERVDNFKKKYAKFDWTGLLGK
ncbi:hypothetical protein PAXRUDRAFT_15491 [Paxillus rubicundulus Ve08.2h10]|uniref:Uncharacterized protein n=1 Tax=Paxillus rubicundulus Ve08.2h10 TaxID=930991 RepID=A0A0D0CZC6_9AGAM|nr:hypothetical protein PAXRUDRAFT_15491 [Paxillus rubicundulus Ve08.2h10]